MTIDERNRMELSNDVQDGKVARAAEHAAEVAELVDLLKEYRGLFKWIPGMESKSYRCVPSQGPRIDETVLRSIEVLARYK